MNIHKCFYKLFYISLFFVCLYACKKKDPLLPIIEVKTPNENSIFTVGDSIFIEAIITHEKKIKYITLGIVNENLILVGARFTYYPEGSYYNLNTFTIINNIELLSGNYYLHIKASDGTDETNSYTRLYINEKAKQFEGALILTKDPALFCNIRYINHAFEQSIIGSLSSDFGFATYDPINKLMYVGGKQNSFMYAYNYLEKQLAWQVQILGQPPAPYFYDGINYRKKTYTCSHVNGILVYDDNASLVLIISNDIGKYPYKIHINNDLIVTARGGISGNNSYITTNYIESGAFVNQLLINQFKVLHFFNRDAQNIFVLGNNINNEAHLYMYNTYNNTLWQPYTLPLLTLKYATQIDAHNLLLALGDNIYVYNYAANTLTPFLSQIDVKCMQIDPINKRLWIGSNDKKVLVYTFPIPSLIEEWLLTDIIYDIILAFNK